METSLARRFDDSELRALFGAATFLRASAYAQQGRVVELTVDEVEHTLSGVVAGSGGQYYNTIVNLDDRDLDIGLDAYCSCPVGVDCKHAAALILAAQGQAASTDAASAVEGVPGRRPDWERSLSAVVDDTAPATTPLALQFEVSDRRPRPSPYTFYRPSTLPERRIRLRPVTPGVSGGWVRNGVSWRQLRPLRGGSTYDADQLAVVRELLLAFEAGTPNPYSSYGGDQVYLDEFGPGLWRLLREAVDCGVQLVPSRKKAPPVRLVSEAATWSLDLTMEHESAGASLTPRLRLGPTEVDPEETDLLGTPAHGIAWHSRDALLLAPLDQPVPARLHTLVRDREVLHIPEADLDRFRSHYYPALRRSVAITSDDASVPLPEVAPPRLQLTVSYHDDHRIVLEWAVGYHVGDAERRFPLTHTESDGVRDPAAERDLIRKLPLPDDRLPYLRSADGSLHSPSIVSGMDAVAFVDQALPPLAEHPDVDVQERGTRPDFRAAAEPPQVQVSTTDSDQADWFDLWVTVEVDGEEVPFDTLFTALAREEEHLLLPSGVWFALDRPELHDLRRLIAEAREMLEEDDDGRLRISRYQAGFWDELCELGVVAEQSERWSASVGGLLDATGPDPVQPPVGLAAELRPYQLDGFRWLNFLQESGMGGVLADDMGLGKTVQTLALLCRVKEQGGLTAPTLVVAPTSVVRNWVNEAHRFAPGLRVASIRSTKARRGTELSDVVDDADVVVTSYSLFRLEFDSYAALPWSGLVLDEAQFVKNHQSKAYQCARRLSAPFKLAVTGTPLENNLMELWAMLSIVAPGLFPSPQKFSEFYRKPIERGADPALLASLRRRIRPLIRRRTKEQVAADLPPKQEQVLEVQLSSRHRTIYDTRLQRERQKILGLLDDLDEHRFTVLRSLTVLRQLSLHAALVDPEHAGVRSAKVDVLLEHLTELVGEGHKALVFSQFTSFLRRIRERLDAEGVPYCYLDGSTRDRDKVIDAFKAGEAPVFLISLKAGGFGLNLTEADYCFILDPWWNPATEAQAVDRTHRIGQDKRVVVYRLVSTDTIEEKVMALKARKAELFGSVMADDGTLSGALSGDDIKALLEP